jgi:poly(3-hydroxybutyrate) depolymerase
MILVIPDSTANERGTGWNTMDPTPEYPVDDVAFLLALIDELDATLNIDRKRVYAGGFSNGGQMTHFLAARTTNVFAAVAAVGSAIGSSRGTDAIIYTPPPAGPIPAMIVNATNDCKRPFWGGINDDGQLQPAVFESVAHYTNANACASLSALSTNRFVTNNASIHRFAQCPTNGLGPAALITNLVIREHYQLTCFPGTEVLFVTLTDGAHIWPSATDNVGFDADREVLEFFLRHCNCDAPGATNTLVVPATPGVYDLTLCDQNYNRFFRLMVPTGYTAAAAAPLVFALHGGEQTVASFSAEHPALFARCNADDVVLVLPQALDHPVTRETLWANKPFDYVVDDRLFVTNLLGHLAGALNIDLRRVYACGFSGGGSFSHYLASTTTGLLAAIAPVCTQTGWNDPNTGAILAPPPPLEAVPVMMVRGTNDTKRPYYGGLNIDGVLCRSAADDVAYWTAGNGCNPAFSTTVNANVTIYQHSICLGTTEVILVRVDGMPHIWPDASDGYTLDANDAVITFLLRHARP